MGWTRGILGPVQPTCKEGLTVSEERAQTIARLTRLMKRNDGWVTLFSPESGIPEAYARFQEQMSRLSRKDRRRGRDGLLLEIAASFVDSGLRKGLSYKRMNEDLAKIEQGLSG